MSQADVEQRKLDLEERRVAIEERQARHAFLTKLGIIIPVVAALIAFGADVVVQRLNANDALSLQRTRAQADFELKVADLVMNVHGPFESRGRAVALREIFANRLGKEFARTFNPEDATNKEATDRDALVASKKELLTLIAEHPAARKQLVLAWERLFPKDTWAHNLD
jgi:hypothetical protein